MTAAQKIEAALRPFLGAEFDAEAEASACGALEAEGFDTNLVNFTATARHQDTEEHTAAVAQAREEIGGVEAARRNPAAFEALVAKYAPSHPGIRSLTVQFNLTVEDE